MCQELRDNSQESMVVAVLVVTMTVLPHTIMGDQVMTTTLAQ